MADDVRVNITDRSVISALNTPGGLVYEWRNKVGKEIADRAYDMSPVNNPLNAKHRGGVVGTYKKGWHVTRSGNQHRLTATIFNTSDHAGVVEEGRRGSNLFQRFSWTQWGGEIRSVGGMDKEMGRGTRARAGKHILRNATNYVMAKEAGATPLA